MKTRNNPAKALSTALAASLLAFAFPAQADTKDQRMQAEPHWRPSQERRSAGPAHDSRERQNAREMLSSLETMSNGIGEGDREEPAGYPVKIVFATPEGEYYANVRVSFQKEGAEREVFSEGPWLFVRGDPGRYRVEAEAADGAAAGAILNLPGNGNGLELLVLSLEEKETATEKSTSEPPPYLSEADPRS